MKTPVIHRQTKTWLFVIGGLAVSLFTAYFLLEFRAAQVIKLIVENQSHGQFHIDMDDVDISLSKRKVEIADAFIQQFDTVTNKATATIKLPVLNLQLNSWRSLVFQKKLLIDSSYFGSPSFETTLDSSGNNNDVSFQAAKVFSGLQEVVTLLNIQSLRLKNGSLILHSQNSSVPFKIHGIDFLIRNFGGEANKKDHFFLTDEIDLTISKQDWKLEDGLEIKFKKFHFSGSQQTLQLDSCEFVSNQEGVRSNVRVLVDKISLKSDSLSAFFEKGELVVDTLLLTHPFVQLHMHEKAPGDTATVINESLKRLFPNIRVKHFNIVEGQFAVESMRNGKSLTYTTHETDIKVDDVAFRPRESSFLTIGNLTLQMKELSLYTADSLYRLTLEEFDVNNYDVRFKNALFGPAKGNHKDESFLVAIPVLALHRINLDDLLDNRLGAEEAEMLSPVVTIQSHGEVKHDEHGNRNLAGFYELLHGLSELLHVKTLNVTNATVSYTSSAADSLRASMRNFNTTISLNDFLNSASLIDVKHSIPYFQVEKIIIDSKKVKATLNDFHLHGIKQHNGIASVELQTASGVTFNATDFYWHKLDLDTLNDKHAFIADSVHMGKLSVSANEMAKREPGAQKELPLIDIQKVSVDKFEMHYQFPEGGLLTAKGKDYLLSHVSSAGNKFSWSDASGDFTSVKYKTDKFSASIDKLHLETPGETRLKDVEADFVNHGTELHADINEMKVDADITSTDLTNLNLQSLFIDKPDINFIQSMEDSDAKGSFAVPLDLAIGELKVTRGKLKYSSYVGTDTMRISSKLEMTAESFHTSKNNSDMLQFKNMMTAFSNLSFTKKDMNATAPSLSLTFADGKVAGDSEQINIQSTMSGNWNDVALRMNLKNGSKFDLANISGRINSIPLRITTGEDVPWMDWLKRTDISDSKILFTDSSKTLSAEKVTWYPENKELQIDSFMLQPGVNAREYFRNSLRQSDHIQMKGERMVLSGFDADAWIRDTLFKVHKVDLKNLDVDVSRDKRIPFQHGKEKMMPTKLINSIQTKFNIDSLAVENGSVTYHEFSDLTGREGTVPLENITAVVKKLSNDHGGNQDTLSLKGSAQLLSCNITKFHYKEVYDDSLSSFLLTAKIAPAQLSELSKITSPLLAIDVVSGYCDTVNARATGNKYASIGQMQFYYHDLKIHLLNREDTLNKRFSLSFVTFVANSFVVRSKNHKQSSIFFVRDRERFIFNYWIKTLLSGVLTSAGIKRNGKYDKQYKKMKSEYLLPQESL